MEQMLLSLKKLLKTNKRTTVFVFIGILGMLFIAFGGATESEASHSGTVNQYQSGEEYCNEVEGKIKKLVTAITGSDGCVVAVTLENSGEYVYANQNTLDRNQTEDKKTDVTTTKESHKTEQEYIIVEGRDGEQTALIVTEKKPNVRGVAIVAEGINNMNYDLILNSVSAMLGVPDRKISLAEAF